MPLTTLGQETRWAYSTRDHAAKMQTRDYTDNFEFQYNQDENMAELSYINFTEHNIAYL